MEIRRLNTLRGIAACLVLLSHYANFSGIFKDVLGDGGGQVGVMLFFVLSGFLMGLLYLNRPVERGAVRNFFVSRAARVLPLYMLVVLVSMLVGWPYPIQGFPEILQHVFFLSGESVLWTIPVEIQFYFLFAVYWMAAPKVKRCLLIALLLILAVVFWGGGIPKRTEYLGLEINLMIFYAIPYFAVGVFWGAKYERISSVARTHRGASLSLGLVLLLFPGVGSLILPSSLVLWGAFTPVLLVAGSFFMYAFVEKPGLAIIENPIGDFMGDISYSLYLLHLPVLYFVASRLPAVSSGIVICLAFLLSLVLSALSYRFIESPSRRYLRAKGLS